MEHHTDNRHAHLLRTEEARQDARVSEEEQRALVVLAQAAHRPEPPGATPDCDLARLAEQRLVEANTGLVCYLATRVARGSPAEREDLESVGFAALLRAVRRVDASKEGRLSGYFAAAVLHAMWREACRACGDRSSAVTSIAEVGEIEDRAPSVEDQALSALEAGRLVGALGQLPETERELLVSRYGLDGSDQISQRALAAELATTRKTICYKEEKALGRLRVALGAHRR
jgi:RNA polymerase sigma factor (sigma-70 family)